jgi:D-3-phosphoglycerate dehydrogenase
VLFLPPPSPRLFILKSRYEQQAILIRSHKLQVSEIPKSVCAIARCGAGTNNIPVADLSARGIPVFNTPGANANAVKELVLCGLLLASRRIHQGINHVLEVAENEGAEVAIGRVEKDKKLFAGQELSGKTLGVIGLGAIGAGVANAASSLGMKVVGYDPHITVESALALNFKGTQLQMANSMEHVIGAADYLSLHAPVIKGVTEGMINRQALESMRPGCNIINFARGELVDAPALKAALDAGVFKGTYISDFPDKHLLGYPNVIGMPHLGASTEEAEENSSSMAADTIMSFLETGSVINSVNFPTIKAEPKSDQIALRACIVNENKSGMLAQITNSMSTFNVSRQQNDSRGEIAYNLIDLEDMPDDLDGLMQTVTGIDGVLSARFIVSADGENSRYKLNRDNSLM